MGTATVLYDVDCGFCRWSLAKVLAWDRRRALRPVAIGDPEADRLLGGMPEHERLASWHLVLPDGRRFSAGPAVVELARLLPGGRAPARLLRALSPITNRGYELVARRRAVPGRMLSRKAVRRATERIRARSGPDSLIADERVAAGCATRPPGAAPAPPQTPTRA